MISHECASCTLPYGLKLDYIMETVPSVQFRSLSLDINVEALALPHGHDLDGISALVVPIRGLMSHSADLGDTRISVRDKMCQTFSSNVREANSKGEAQFNALVPQSGGKVLVGRFLCYQQLS